MYIVRYGMCVCICMFVGEHVCRPSLLCNPVYDKIDNNNNNNCNRIRVLESSSKSHMKSSVFLHVFKDISTYTYVFRHSFSNYEH